MNQISTSHTSKSRDTSLDILRSTALILMICAHASDSVPDKTYSSHSELFEFIAQSAPAFFFLAFGLTFNFFQRKTTDDKLEIGKRFLYISLAHNLFFKKSIFKADFFWFLWFWQLFLGLLESRQRVSNRFYACSILILLGFMIFLPFPLISEIFQGIIDSSFPILPWGVFPVVGVLFSRIESSIIIALSGISMITLSGTLVQISFVTGWESLSLSKWHLTAPYALLFCGVALVLKVVFQTLAKSLFASSHNSFLLKITEFVSKNLLLATVVHYVPFLSFVSLSERFLYSSPELIEPLEKYNFLLLVAISITSIVLTICFSYLTLWTWNQIKHIPFFEKIRENYDLNSIVILVLSGILNFFLLTHASRYFFRFLLWVPLLYFSLESSEWNTQRRQA